MVAISFVRRVDLRSATGRKKTHPCLVPYEELPEIEKDYDRNTAIGTLKLIQALGFDIVKKR